MRERIGIVVLLVGLVVLSGCLTVNVRADLHRDKSMDFSVGVESESEFVLNSVEKMIKQQFNNGSATLSESSNSIEYTWKRVRQPEISTPDQSNGSQLVDTDTLDFNISHNYTFPITYTYRVEFASEGMDVSDIGNGSTSSFFGSGTGSGIGFNFYLDPFGKVTETNGVKTDSGAVKFDLLEDKTYYIEFTDHVWNTWLAALSGSACQEEWSCTEWSACTNGTRTRECTASNTCDSYLYRPQETRSCGDASTSTLDFGEMGDTTSSSNGEFEEFSGGTCIEHSPAFIEAPFGLDSWEFTEQNAVEMVFSLDDYALEENATINEITLSFDDRGNVTSTVNEVVSSDETVTATVSGIDWLASGDCLSADTFVHYDTPSESGLTDGSVVELQREVP